MSLIVFLTAVFSLLLAPGPTNTLIGLAGAQGGMRQVLRLMPFELAGYLCAILPLSLFGGPLLAALPMAAEAVRLLAALWVMWLAIRLWGRPGLSAGAETISGRQIFLTTLFNPKALVFALALLPAPAEAAFVPRLALFCGALLIVAGLWGAAGALARRIGSSPETAKGRLKMLYRLASVWLGLVSASLALSVLGS